MEFETYEEWLAYVKQVIEEYKASVIQARQKVTGDTIQEGSVA